MEVFSWLCHSIKSLSLSTPDVRTSKSSGGAPAVSILLFSVSTEMVSGSRYDVPVFEVSSFSEGLMTVDVAEEWLSPVDLPAGDADRESSSRTGGPSLSSPAICFRMCCVMCDSENVRLDGV